jgi:hypothetical protein
LHHLLLAGLPAHAKRYPSLLKMVGFAAPYPRF